VWHDLWDEDRRIDPERTTESALSMTPELTRPNPRSGFGNCDRSSPIAISGETSSYRPQDLRRRPPTPRNRLIGSGHPRVGRLFVRSTTTPKMATFVSPIAAPSPLHITDQCTPLQLAPRVTYLAARHRLGACLFLRLNHGAASSGSRFLATLSCSSPRALIHCVP